MKSRVLSFCLLLTLCGCKTVNDESLPEVINNQPGVQNSFDQNDYAIKDQGGPILQNLADISPGQYLQTLEFMDDTALVFAMTGTGTNSEPYTYITTFDTNENTVIAHMEIEETNIQFTKDFLYLPFMDELLLLPELEWASDSILVGYKGGIVSESGAWVVPYSNSEEVMTFTNRYTGETVSVKLNEKYPRVKGTNGFLNDNTVIHTYCDDFANTFGIGITSMEGAEDFYETQDTHIAVVNGHALTSMRYFWDAADYPYIRKTDTQNKLVDTTIPNEGEFKLTADGKYIRQWRLANNYTTDFVGSFMVNLYDYDTEKLVQSFDVQFEDGYTYAQDSCAVSTDGNKIAFLSVKEGERFLCILE